MAPLIIATPAFSTLWFLGTSLVLFYRIFFGVAPYILPFDPRLDTDWRGHRTSPTVVSLKGRLPEIMQSTSTLSCHIIQIHSLFRHGFIKKRNQNLTEIQNRRILFICNGFRKTDLGTDLIANAFRGSIQNTRLFSSFIFCSIIYLFGKRKGAYSCLPSKDSLNYSLSLFKGWFHLRSFYAVRNASCSFTYRLYRSIKT